MRSLRRALAALAVLAAGLAPFGPAAASDADKQCLGCHGSKNNKLVSADDSKRQLRRVSAKEFAESVHSKMACADCHADVTDNKAPHKKTGAAKPECMQCHQDLWAKVEKDTLSGKERLGIVAQNIAAYKKSFHARTNKDDPTHANASCNDCHDTHTFKIPTAKDPKHAAWRLSIPETCGARCHEEQLEDFQGSTHGKAVAKGESKAAVCVDCHTSHAIVGSSSDPFKLANVDACGGCHKDRLSSYADTYHGQVNRLGFTYTAKCYDCHGSHGIRKADDPQSMVHPDNRLKTCKKCHNDKKPGMHDATPGFITFGPHANTHDFAKYPQMWIASKFMVALLIGVFAFFWLHCGLWYYREWKDRQEGKRAQHVALDDLELEGKHFQRFPWGWRLAHLVFALITMTLVLTGTTALYAESVWAPYIAKAFGGPRTVGLIHRIAAASFVGIFFIHFVYVMQKLLRSKTFRWFGPDSLIPNWKDLTDCWGMFKWFLGKGPRPQFDRWAYYEKFDYWAVFWGVNIIGWSGLMLAFPHVTAKFLPGWIFNVGTLVHGEEAFLAAVFLFTVHFFNNHFRPDKLPPPDVVMFTGTQSLDEFRHDHPAQYQRLLASGELQKYLVDVPSRPLTMASKVLGLVLIAVGFVLLALVAIGFFSNL